MFVSDCYNVNEKGHLTISGCDTVELAEKYGTALYVMSEDEIRSVCRRYKSSFERHYNGNGTALYASKAFCCKEICRIVTEEGLDLDVVSGGELYTALAAGVDAKHIHFHGNNKTMQELCYALESGVGDIVVDNLNELHRIEKLSAEKGVVTSISMRIKPGIDAHTHEFIRTGQIDSKFGFALENGEVVSVTGNTCPRGAAYGRREVTNPTRIVTSTALVSGGVLPVVSVKTASDIPKGKIKDVMEAIRQIHAVAPVQIGDVLLRDAAGTGADIVATKNIPVATGFREN